MTSKPDEKTNLVPPLSAQAMFAVFSKFLSQQNDYIAINLSYDRSFQPGQKNHTHMGNLFLEELLETGNWYFLTIF